MTLYKKLTLYGLLLVSFVFIIPVHAFEETKSIQVNVNNLSKMAQEEGSVIAAAELKLLKKKYQMRAHLVFFMRLKCYWTMD